MERKIVSIQQNPQWKARAAQWFHEKWQIPLSAYEESMEECLQSSTAVPQWYVMIDSEEIVGGLGVIENDFHTRKDLTPNVCAVYVEETHRRQRIAGQLVQHVCDNLAEKGVHVLYLLTDHTGFYERYGWEFLCMVESNDGEMSRMYVHRA